jgi:hypothetical protein
LRAAQAGAFVIGKDGFLLSPEKQLAALTLRHSIPAIFQYREFVTAGESPRSMLKTWSS